MPIRDRCGLKSAADHALSHAPDHRKLVLISTGCAAAAVLLASILSMLIDRVIANTGGLAGLGTRSVLNTVQAVLSLSVSVLMPFWSLGLVSAMLKLSRGQAAAPATLFDGFRRFWPALRLMVLRYAIYTCVAALCAQLIVPVLTLTPLARPMLTLLEQNPDLMASANLDDATLYALLEAMAPVLLACGIACLALLGPLFYSFRMADLRIMDDPKCGALAALLESSRMMRGNRLSLLRLDVSFWWFYLIQALAAILVNGTLVLDLLGIPLPISRDLAYLLLCAAGLLAELVLFYFTRAQLEVTYAKAYDALHNP